MAKRIFRIGTRGSDLALWQARFLQTSLAEQGHSAELVIIRTTGDRIQDRSFAQMPGVGFFTAELEHALLQNEVDIAVHSHKDLPTQGTDGLVVASVSSRADAADWLVMQPARSDSSRWLSLAEGAVVGTSSARRKAQLLALRPDLRIVDLRGNVPTRVDAVRQGKLDAAVLAGAGLQRLGLDLSELNTLRLDPADFPPAPAQGVLAFQVRKADPEALTALALLNDEQSARDIRAERRLLAQLRGGCQLPLGAYAREQDGLMHFSVSLGETPDRFPRRLYLEHPDPDVLVVEAWQRLHAPPPASVFLSREPDPDSLMARACADHGIVLYAHSLLELEALNPTWPAHADWLVFSSRSAVRIFGRQRPPMPAGVRLAASGEGTARELLALGFPVHFVLEWERQEASLEALRDMVQGQRVLFPGAEDGLRSLQQGLEGAAELMDLALYRNRPRADAPALPPVELAMLTSPMNAREYLRLYPERASDKLVAIGSSTAKELRQRGARRVYQVRKPSELALVEALFSA
jgi:hydroxymethylbilane synthase